MSAAGLATQQDIWSTRVAETEKLALDFQVFEPIAKDQWDGETLCYHWVDSIKNGEAKARFTVADLKSHSKQDDRDAFCPPHPRR